MYQKHLNNCKSRADQNIAKHFNPMAASATIANNLEAKHPKPEPKKIWRGITVVAGRIMGNTYIRSKHGLIGNDKEVYDQMRENLKKDAPNPDNKGF